MDIISIVIPMYNAEKYIEQCLQSVMNQTYRGWEALVIDDGSTDQSLEICRKLSLADSRIQVYHQARGGASRARNYGLDLAIGDYVFFLDSDDAIHPLLLEEMIRQAQSRQAKMVFCDCVRVDNRHFEDITRAASVKDVRPEWQIAEGAVAEEWFHIKYTKELSGVWGLFCRGHIGTLRFDESLVNGEDTLFKYYLFCKQGRVMYSPIQWYYYRMHSESTMHSEKILLGRQRFECYKKIRDSEYQRGRIDKFALRWEHILIIQMRKKHEMLHRRRDKGGCAALREEAIGEVWNPMFKRYYMSARILFICCFFCYPIYVSLNWINVKVWEWRENHKNGRVL
ncbi:MAG: glycosyltransferase family 2 protein [Ruminococcus flavefaciens]|nr:glycosyltransferase family 2 protein [Ruminococcus flavefaciens]